MTLRELRKKKLFRFFESILGLSTISFFLFLLIGSFFIPAITAAIILLYSFFWLLRVTIIQLYTIFSYKQFRRWRTIDAYKLINLIKNQPKKAVAALTKFQKQYKGKIHWKHEIQRLLDVLNNTHRKVADPTAIIHFPLFSVYNESYDVLIKSLKSVKENKYTKGGIIVCISQEKRLGEEKNKELRKKLAATPWIQLIELPDFDPKVIYENSDSRAYGKILSSIVVNKEMLPVLITAHPDGLLGEIKGKASNEDWGARCISLFAHYQSIPSHMCMIISLDADSSIDPYFCSLLSLHYSLAPQNTHVGFQALPVYTKNLSETNIIPRLIAFQTTLWTTSLYRLEGRTHFFANYAVPLSVLKEVNFWDREHIAEDFIFYIRCLTHYNGNFSVLPFYGIFNGDAVIGDDYVHAIENQYMQYQRWSWGGVESLALLLWKFFKEKNSIPFFTKIKEISGVFINHHFWATAPMLFTFGILLPNLFGGAAFEQSQISQNLELFGSYFASISFIFVAIIAFLTYDIITRTVKIRTRYDTFLAILKVIAQSVMSPFIYGFLALPAIDAQLRGVFGNYIGYWVTPKK